MSKAYAAEAPLAILGGVLGSNSIGGILAHTGASFAANSVLLKFSRDAERQADLMGTQILYDTIYDSTVLLLMFSMVGAFPSIKLAFGEQYGGRDSTEWILMETGILAYWV